VEAPLTLTERGLYGLAFLPPVLLLDYERLSETARYHFSKPGFFVEGSAEYSRNVTNNFDVSFWIQASWLHVTGQGEVDLNAQNAGNVWFVFPFSGGVDASSSGSSTLRRSIVSGGVTAALAF